ncbi:MAG: S41 family peptidase [Burkholderiales bacterium]|nr:S41 family peptidase [Burkholderiales bacterium]
MALTVALLVGCGGGGSSPSTTPAAPLSCSTADQRSWLQGYMADQYYWFENVSSPNADASDMYVYFKSMLYTPLDRYSYAQSTAQYNQFFKAGSFVGYGYSLVWADAAHTIMKVRQVEPNGPVAQAGLKRGDTIVAIDSLSPTQIEAGLLGQVSTAGVTRAFVVRNAANVTRSFSATSAEFALVSVPAKGVLMQTITGANAPIGYMQYQQFISTSVAELTTAFNQFASAGVKELVLDLRYNGGGSVSIARDLASMIGGSGLVGRTFVEMRFNRLHSDRNTVYPFIASGLPALPLQGLKRVFIITAEGTASASELVINGLKPFTEVVQIGATTYGKPYGFYPVDACGITYSAVNFESFNADGVGGYNDGITPTCEVDDDLDHQLGDPAEARLAAALTYLKTGACPARATQATAVRATAGLPRSTQRNVFGEVRPIGMRVD